MPQVPEGEIGAEVEIIEMVGSLGKDRIIVVDLGKEIVRRRKCVLT
jgi:hypothetical protein